MNTLTSKLNQLKASLSQRRPQSLASKLTSRAQNQTISPQPHVTHVNHGGMHHAAASSYSPAVAQIAAAATAAAPAIQSQQLATSASNTNHQMAAYRAPAGHHHHHHSLYHPMQAASAHQIINSYAPSPPLYVDEAGGLYGHYGNAYGRYDGGYQLW